MALLEPKRSAWLVPLAGPPIDAIELSPKPNGTVLGRHDDCDVRLPPTADKVSRFHARFQFDSDRWRIADLKSRWGTYLNGVKLTPGPDVPLNEGDLVRVTPWTFGFRSTPPTAACGIESHNDTQQMQTMVRAIKQEDARPLADDMLALLLESAAGIHASQDEASLAQVVLDVAIRGTGLSNAALLRPVDGSGRIEVVATESKGSGAIPGKSPPIAIGGLYSRSLLAAASSGIVAELSGISGADIAQSIVQMKISSAICVPLMLGQTVAAYLYLDSRGSGATMLRPNASAFCLALGRMSGLALANLKRIDIERRQALMEAELSAGAEAQRWILPRRNGEFGSFRYLGECRPGQYVGGDFFDVIPLGEDRLAVALGDVSGKGIPASVLMTAAQGYLHAALREHGDPGRAVTDLNRFINPRRPESKFVTLWVGVFDGKTKSLHYVDAGHGWALTQSADGAFTHLSAGDGLPVGIMEDTRYQATTLPLSPGGKSLIVSDGIIEQFGPVTDAAGNVEQHQFGMEGVHQALKSIPPGADEVASLFERLKDYAGTDHFSDDATMVLVRW